MLKSSAEGFGCAFPVFRTVQRCSLWDDKLLLSASCNYGSLWLSVSVSGKITLVIFSGSLFHIFCICSAFDKGLS